VYKEEKRRDAEMKKCLALGIIAFSLMATTVYAFNGNGRHSVNHETEVYHQNCPYQDEVGNCPYHENTTNHEDCSNCASSQQHNEHHNTTTNTGNYSGHGRHGHHH
jgi:hypothetical protein